MNCSAKHNGIPLRDYFAAQVLSNSETYETLTPKELAADAYQVADAMLAERLKACSTMVEDWNSCERVRGTKESEPPE